MINATEALRKSKECGEKAYSTIIKDAEKRILECVERGETGTCLLIGNYEYDEIYFLRKYLKELGYKVQMWSSSIYEDRLDISWSEG